MKTTSFSAPELLERATTLVSSREQLEGALRQAEASLPTIEAKLQAGRQQLATAEAGAALDDKQSAKQELAALNQVMLQREACRARVAGLHAKLADQEDELNKVMEELAQGHADWSRTAWKHFLREDYSGALKSFREVLNRGRSVGLALGINVTLPSATDFLDLPAITPTPEFSQPLETLNALRRFSNEARSRREFREQQSRFAAPFDPAGTFTIMGDCRVNGVPHKSGDLVTAREIPLELLEKLHRTRKIKLVPVSDYITTGG